MRILLYSFDYVDLYQPFAPPHEVFWALPSLCLLAVAVEAAVGHAEELGPALHVHLVVHDGLKFGMGNCIDLLNLKRAM